MPSITLFIGNHNYSSWSLRPWILLRHLGLQFDEVVIPLDQPDTRARIEAVNPAGRLPLLRHGALDVWESLAICEYAASWRARACRVIAPPARARARWPRRCTPAFRRCARPGR